MKIIFKMNRRNRLIVTFNSRLCGLCNKALDDPVTLYCHHRFCRKCLLKWCRKSLFCPKDIRPIIADDLRYVINGLTESQINGEPPQSKVCCAYRSDGCRVIVYSESLEKHQKNCFYNPNKRVFCLNNCSKVMTREQRKTHNCQTNKFRLIIILISILSIIIFLSLNCDQYLN